MRADILSHSQVVAVDLVRVVAQHGDRRQQDEQHAESRRARHVISFYTLLRWPVQTDKRSPRIIARLRRNDDGTERAACGEKRRERSNSQLLSLSTLELRPDVFKFEQRRAPSRPPTLPAPVALPLRTLSTVSLHFLDVLTCARAFRLAERVFQKYERECLSLGRLADRGRRDYCNRDDVSCHV